MVNNWDDLRVFLGVARAGSLTAGAKLLRLDPATLGRRISRLETSLGQVLFYRSPRGYSLTSYGAEVLSRAERAEDLLRAPGKRQQQQGLSGQIRIGAPDGAANFLLPQVCSLISQDNPSLDIQIVALPRVLNLTKREADMAISVSAPQSGRQIVQKIVDYKLHLAAAKSYLRGNPPILTLEDLKQHPIVGYIPDMIFDKELDYLADLGLARVPFASNSVAVQTNALRQGVGVGVVHDFSVPIVGGLTRILTDQVSLTRSFYLVRPEEDRRNVRLGKFAEILMRGLRAEVPRLEAIA